MNQFQKGLRFRDVEEMLDYLPEDQREITEALRGIILGNIPGLKEKLSYNVPFYSRHAPIVYIWPSAIPWGGNETEGVVLGFAKGVHMVDPSRLFVGQTTKSIRKVNFKELSELTKPWILTYLLEAMVLDEELRR